MIISLARNYRFRELWSTFACQFTRTHSCASSRCLRTWDLLISECQFLIMSEPRTWVVHRLESPLARRIFTLILNKSGLGPRKTGYIIQTKRMSRYNRHSMEVLMARRLVCCLLWLFNIQVTLRRLIRVRDYKLDIDSRQYFKKKKKLTVLNLIKSKYWYSLLLIMTFLLRLKKTTTEEITILGLQRRKYWRLYVTTE